MAAGEAHDEHFPVASPPALHVPHHVNQVPQLGSPSSATSVVAAIPVSGATSQNAPRLGPGMDLPSYGLNNQGSVSDLSSVSRESSQNGNVLSITEPDAGPAAQQQQQQQPLGTTAKFRKQLINVAPSRGLKIDPNTVRKKQKKQAILDILSGSSSPKASLSPVPPADNDQPGLPSSSSVSDQQRVRIAARHRQLSDASKKSKLRRSRSRPLRKSLHGRRLGVPSPRGSPHGSPRSSKKGFRGSSRSPRRPSSRHTKSKRSSKPSPMGRVRHGRVSSSPMGRHRRRVSSSPMGRHGRVSSSSMGRKSPRSSRTSRARSRQRKASSRASRRRRSSGKDKPMTRKLAFLMLLKKKVKMKNGRPAVSADNSPMPSGDVLANTNNSSNNSSKGMLRFKPRSSLPSEFRRVKRFVNGRKSRSRSLGRAL